MLGGIINEKGPLKAIANRYMARQIEREKRRLTKAKFLDEQNLTLLNIREINEKLGVVMQQNNIMISYMERLTNGPGGDVHYIKIADYSKNEGPVFIDFVRGDKDNRSKLPPGSQYTFPYSNVFMIKITNDGPASISYQTNRHAHMIDLYAGESDTVSENENFQLTELRLANNTDNNANIRVVVYA